MRYAICNETFEGWDHRRICRLVADLGYGGLEMAPFTLAPRITDVSLDDRHKLRHEAEAEHDGAIRRATVFAATAWQGRQRQKDQDPKTMPRHVGLPSDRPYSALREVHFYGRIWPVLKPGHRRHSLSGKGLRQYDD